MFFVCVHRMVQPGSSVLLVRKDSCSFLEFWYEFRWWIVRGRSRAGSRSCRNRSGATASETLLPNHWRHCRLELSGLKISNVTAGGDRDGWLPGFADEAHMLAIGQPTVCARGAVSSHSCQALAA